MRVIFASLLALSPLVLAGCGARTGMLGDDAPAVDAPVALFAGGGAACVDALDPTQAEAVLATSEDEEIAVVDLAFVSECSGLGGDYLIGREVGGTRMFWLGGHGCEFFDDTFGPGLVYGVVRYAQTAALFQTPEGVCVSWPGEPEPVQSSSSTFAIAVFETLGGAQSFAASL
jgi:hypothetical protein